MPALALVNLGHLIVRQGVLGVQARGSLKIVQCARLIALVEPDLASQEVEISSDVTISLVYKSDGGSVRGIVENCASGGIVLVPIDSALRRTGFSKSAPCDSAGHYEVRGVRPGEYYALALAGNGPVLALNEASSLLDEASKVTVRSGESSSADLRAVTKPVF